MLSRGIKKLDLYDENTQKLSLGTFLDDVLNIIYDYLDESTTLSRDDINIEFANSNSEKMRETIIDKVTQGVPVIIDAANPNGGAHSFIAYDYDAVNDEIYCNAGWYNSSTYHISMTDLGYTRIQEIMYFEPKFDHQHSLNYSRYDESGELVNCCACTSVIPTEIEIVNNYLDVSPTFKWNSLIKEKWSEKDDLYQSLSILKYNHNEFLQINDIHDNEYTLNSED